MWIEVLFSELADPPDTPAAERLDHRSQLLAGCGQLICDAVAVLAPLDHTGAYQRPQALRQ
ncbi:MAG TPA: hypothetical protein VK923_13865 [Euzebyales bacterium]|nr:hypothetical protein [Euzebyales bacterium]